MMGDVGIAMAHEDDPEHESRQKADSTLESRDNVWCHGERRLIVMSSVGGIRVRLERSTWRKHVGRAFRL